MIENAFLENANISIHSESNTPPPSFNALKILKLITVNHIQLNELLIKKGELTLYLKGEMTDHWDFQWKIHIPDLHELFPELHGLVETEGTIIGPRSMPTLHAVLHSQSLRFKNNKIGQLDGKTDIAIKPFAASSIQLSLKNITFNEQFFETLKLRINGNIAYEKQNLVSVFSITTGFQNENKAHLLRLLEYSNF